MSETREFTTGAVITVATGKMCADIGEIYEILNWLIGESLMTHQLPAASRAVEADVLRQHPWISELDTNSVNRENVRAWYDEIVERYGPRTTVSRTEGIDWVHGNAIQDLVDIAGERKIIGVQLPE
jgi:hypothetical protein